MPKRQRERRTPPRAAYIQDAAGSSTSAADELSRLADLKAQGVIDDAEFQRLKANVVAPAV